MEGDSVDPIVVMERQLLDIKVKIDDDTNGFVFSRKKVQDEFVWHCHLCNARIQNVILVQDHTDSQKHQKRLAVPQHPRNLFKRIEQIPARKPYVNPESEAVLEAQIQKTLDKYTGVSLIGLEYLVEIVPLFGDEEPRYTCVLCDKRGDPRIVLGHLTSFKHYLKYLKEHFPIAYRELVNQYPQDKSSKSDLQNALNELCFKIEETYGRLKPVVCMVDYYEMNQNLIKKSIVNGNHFREPVSGFFPDRKQMMNSSSWSKDSKLSVEDLDYQRRTQVTISAPSVMYATSHLSDPNSSVRKPSTQMPNERVNRISPVKFPGTSAHAGDTVMKVQERIVTGVADQQLVSEKNKLSDAISQRLSSLRKQAEKLKQNETLKKASWKSDERRSKSPVYHHERSEHRTRSHSRDRYRNYPRSRDPYRPGSRSRDPYRPHSRSRDPYRPRSRSRDPYRPCSRSRDLYRPCSRSRGRYRSRSRSPRRNIKRQIQSRSRSPIEGRRTKDSDFAMNYEHFNEEVDRIEKELSQKFKYYYENPERHPSYAAEWKNFWHLKCKELKAKGIDPNKFDFKPEWSKFWDLRSKDLLGEERKIKKSALRAKYGLPSNEEIPGKQREYGENSPPDSSSSSKEKSIFVTEVESKEDVKIELKKNTEEKNITVLEVLQFLTAMESHLGSLGHSINKLLGQSVILEKSAPGSSQSLLNDPENVVLFEMVREKMKGLIIAGIAEGAVLNAVIKCIQLLNNLLENLEKRKFLLPSLNDSALPPADLDVDKVGIAQQIAAALVTQGKTDISQEELRHLINAVVSSTHSSAHQPPPPSLQQQIHEESKIIPPVPEISRNIVESDFSSQSDRSVAEEFSSLKQPNVTQGMHLSDDELKTLLQNFKTLSSEEQEWLIAYLKTVENREQIAQNFPDSAYLKTGENREQIAQNFPDSAYIKTENREVAQNFPDFAYIKTENREQVAQNFPDPAYIKTENREYIAENFPDPAYIKTENREYIAENFPDSADNSEEIESNEEEDSSFRAMYAAVSKQVKEREEAERRSKLCNNSQTNLYQNEELYSSGLQQAKGMVMSFMGPIRPVPVLDSSVRSDSSTRQVLPRGMKMLSTSNIQIPVRRNH